MNTVFARSEAAATNRGRPLFECGYNSWNFLPAPLFVSCYAYSTTLQFKNSIKTSFLLGGSHTYQSCIRHSCYYVRTLRTIIIIKVLRGYYSRAATILLSSPIEL